MDERASLVLHDLSPVHLIGIGGAGMSALAKVLLARGLRVSGSDMKWSPGLAALRALGGTVTVGHDPEHVTGAAGVVVSSAIRPSNPELRAAHEAGIPVLHRAQVLALLMRDRRGIAVAGTHGKTTTTSMIALIFQRAALDPTFLVGGDLNERGTNAHHGIGEWLIAEADESDGSFLWLSPEIAVVTNIEADHLDYYRDEAEVRSTFLAFMQNVRPDGLLVACAEDAGVRSVLSGKGARTITYGLQQGTWTAERIEVNSEGQRVLVRRNGDEAGELTLGVFGRHNILNALAALAVADAAGISFEQAAASLATYQGVQRRFQRRGSVGGITVVDDYAHHPTEIRATLSAAREGGASRLFAVFQPHLYSRTRFLGGQLGAALSGADIVVVTDVYGAREEPEPGVSGKIVVDGLLDTAPRGRVAYLPKRGDVPDYVVARARPGDLVLTIGAGDVTMLGDEILLRLQERAAR